jgi:hypothetical protein
MAIAQQLRGRTVAIAIALLTIACGPNRSEECRELGNATVAVRESIDAAHQAQIGKPAYDPDYERRLAAAWTAGVETVQAVEIRRDRLQALQQDLATAYGYAGTVLQQAAELIPASGVMTHDLEVTHRAYHNQAEAEVAAAIAALNRYCLGGS